MKVYTGHNFTQCIESLNEGLTVCCDFDKYIELILLIVKLNHPLFNQELTTSIKFDTSKKVTLITIRL